METYLKLPKIGQELIFKAAIQLAIIGYGKKELWFY